MRNAHFPLAELVKVIAVTEAATRFRRIFGQAKAAPPGLWLVGDDGIYLMSNREIPNPPDDPENVGAPIVYAAESNPNKTTDWYEAKRRIFGGDDGCDFIPLADAKRWLADMPNAQYLRVTFNERDELEITTVATIS